MSTFCVSHDRKIFVRHMFHVDFFHVFTFMYSCVTM
jgi:hypothetical protein